jgi:uncharacterized protein DUF6916
MDHHRRCRDRVIGADCRIAVVVISAVAAGLTLIGEGVGSADAERWGFTLQFIGPSADPFKQGTYTVDHSALGTSQIFLVPARPTRSAQPYEAV